MKQQQIHKQEVSGRSSSIFLVLLVCISTVESICFVRTVGCGNVFMSSVHGWLTTSKTFTYIQSSSPIAPSAKHWNRHFEKGIYHPRNWETIGNTSTKWYSRLREMRQRNGKQDNIWKIERLKPQKVSSGIWNAPLQRVLSYPIFFIPSITLCLRIWGTA